MHIQGCWCLDGVKSAGVLVSAVQPIMHCQILVVCRLLAGPSGSHPAGIEIRETEQGLCNSLLLLQGAAGNASKGSVMHALL